MSQIICQVYRSSKKEGMYLYVEKKDDLSRVSDALLALFGQPQAAMVLLLKKDRKLAGANVVDVMQQIQERGFYLQMPPAQDAEMQQLAQKNSKLVR